MELKPLFKGIKRLGWTATLCATLTVNLPLNAFAHEDHDEETIQLSGVDQKKASTFQIIKSRSVELTPAESQIGIVNIESVLPILRQVNERYKVFKPQDFKHYVENFHYPYRNRFVLEDQKPPTQVVLHWTANKHTQVPLYTLSAFLRRSTRGRLSERPNQYKNVSNYFLTGSLRDANGQEDAYMVKLTRGDMRSWGDIPRVTAYPTEKGAADDNKYDGRGALGVEIESPNFREFYFNAQQKQKLYKFITLVLHERGLLEQFQQLRYSGQWEQMERLYSFLQNKLPEIDVNARGGIQRDYLYLDQIAKNLKMSPAVYAEASKIFKYISGHGIVAREYNTRMIQAGKRRDANYDKIDFTEPHVFIVAMELLKSGPRIENLIDGNAMYDVATIDLIRQKEYEQQKQQETRILSDMELESSKPPLNMPLTFGMMLPASMEMLGGEGHEPF